MIDKFLLKGSFTVEKRKKNTDISIQINLCILILSVQTVEESWWESFFFYCKLTNLVSTLSVTVSLLLQRELT